MAWPQGTRLLGPQGSGRLGPGQHLLAQSQFASVALLSLCYATSLSRSASSFLCHDDLRPDARPFFLLRKKAFPALTRSSNSGTAPQGPQI